jgi:hypothetical protein
MNKNELLKKMLNKQRLNINSDMKLDFKDIQRILNNINTDIFDNKICCLWNGYITKSYNLNYINFFFKKRKIALNRLLYINFIGELDDDSYLKYICKNKGICCNINHFIKSNNNDIIINNNIHNNNNNIDNNIFIVNFD